MKTKQITTSIALALGMLILFMLPLVAWQGAGEAHAQDVGTASVPQMTVGITQTQFEVFGTGVSTIYLESTQDITVENIMFELEVPDEVVQLRGQPIPLAIVIAGITPPTSTITEPGKIYNYNQSGNRISFQWDWPFTPGLVISAGTKVGIIEIPWSGAKVGKDFVSIKFADIDTYDNNLHGQPGNTADGIIEVTRRQTYIRLDTDTTCGTTQNLELGQVSSGVTNTTVHLSADEIRGVDFELVYDASLIEIVDANISGFVASGGKADTSRPGVIVFNSLVTDPSSPSNQKILEVTWKGLKTGSTAPYLQKVILYDEKGAVINIPATAYGDRTVGNTLPNSCDIIEIEPLAAQLWFEKGSFESVTLSCDTTQQVQVQGVDNINRVEFHVDFDPTQLQVKDLDNTQLGVQIGVGSAFKRYVTNANSANNSTGQIDFALTLNAGETINSAAAQQNLAEIHWDRKSGATTGATANISFRAVAFQSTVAGGGLVLVNVTEYDSTMSTIGAGDCGTSTLTHIIKGQVKDSSGAGISGVTVTTSPGSQTATTDASGTYTITGLADGDYTVTASKTGHTFTSQPVTIAGADKTSVDFTETIIIPGTYSISGTVTDSGGGISGVEVLAGSQKATTGNNGSYTISGLTGNNTVTPSKSGYTFSPTSQPVLAAKTNVNFTGSTTPPGGDITGLIEVQGRGSESGVDYSGAKIVVSEKICSTFTVAEARSATANATTDKDGRFSVKATGTIRCLRVIREGHLTGELSKSNISGDVGSLLLLGGDFNDDDKIDIFDLSTIAARYGKTPVDKIYDFNGDGKGDILDISIVAGNYNKKGPLTNWQP